MKKTKIRLTAVSTWHYFRLVYRSLLFLILLAVYISNRIRQSRGITEHLESRPVILGITWLIFMVEMVLRFFPSRLESPGCQKQFEKTISKAAERTSPFRKTMPPL